jgi:hypothetical protein
MRKACLTVLVPLAMLCGCLQSQTPFYREADLITDRRIPGEYRLGAQPSTNSGQSLTIEHAEGKLYRVTLREGEEWIKYTAGFFRVGTNLFVDLSHHSSEVRRFPAMVTGMEIMKGAVAGGTHCAIAVKITDFGIEIHPAMFAALGVTIQDEDAVKWIISGEMTAILIGRTESLQKVLLRNATNLLASDKRTLERFNAPKFQPPGWW